MSTTVSKNRPKAPLGASLIVLSSFFYATYGIWTKLTGNFFGGYTASGIRSIIVLAILIPIAQLFHQLGPINWRQNRGYIIGMFVPALFSWGPLYYSVLHAGIALSFAVNYASILLGVFFFGWLFAKERLDRFKISSAILGLIGLALIFSPSATSVVWLALGGSLLSGVCNAAIIVLAKEIPYNATQSTVMVWVTCALANFCMVPIIGESIPKIGWHTQWLYLAIFALASVIASWSFVKGSKLVEAGVAGILGLLEVVFSILFGMIFFSERPNSIALVGAAVIIAAAAIPYIKDFNVDKGKLGT